MEKSRKRIPKIGETTKPKKRYWSPHQMICPIKLNPMRKALTLPSQLLGRNQSLRLRRISRFRGHEFKVMYPWDKTMQRPLTPQKVKKVDENRKTTKLQHRDN